MNQIELFQEVGLSPQEAKIYLKLLEVKESKTGQLCNETGVARSNIYNILESLKSLGLVDYKIVNNVKIYTAAPVESFKELISERKDELEKRSLDLEKFIRGIKERGKKNENISDYRYFEGIRGIRSIFLELNNIMKPNSEAYVFSANEETWKMLEGFLIEHHKIRVRKKIHEKMILPATAKNLAKTRKKIGNIEIKYLDHKNPAEFGVFEDHVIIQYLGSKVPRGFMIKDQLMAETFRNIFENLWSIAKK